MKKKNIAFIEKYPVITEEICKNLGRDSAVDILYHLSSEPLRYSQLKFIIECSDNTLSRRLKSLQQFHLIKKLDVTIGNKKTNEYTLTNEGQELMNYFRKYVDKIYKIKKPEVEKNGEKIKI